MDALSAFVGFGQGFESQIEVVESVRSPIWRIIRTYLFGWIVVPALALAGPIGFLVAAKFGAETFGYDMKANGAWLPLSAGFLGLLWIGVLVSLILDRSAGRFHVNPESQN